MAYVANFNGINSALNPEDEEQQRLQRQGEAEGAPVGAQGSAAPSGGMGGAPGYTQSNFASGRKILEKAQGQQLKDAGGLFGDIEKKRTGAEQQIGVERANVQKQAQDKLNPFQVSDQDISKGIAGGEDTAEYKKLSGLFAAKDDIWGGKDPSFNSINGPSVAEVNALGTQSGLADAMRKKLQGKQNYSRGMSALDAQIYQKDPMYLAKLQELGQRVSKTGQDVDQFQTKEVGDIKKGTNETVFGKEGQEGLQAQVKGKLGKEATNIRAAGTKAAQESFSSATSPALKKSIYNNTLDQLADRDDLTKADKEEIANLTARNSDWGTGTKYVPGSSELYDQNQIAQFGRINTLLNGKDAITAGERASTILDEGESTNFAQKHADKRAAKNAEKADFDRRVKEYEAADAANLGKGAFQPRTVEERVRSDIAAEKKAAKKSVAQKEAGKKKAAADKKAGKEPEVVTNPFR